MDRKKALEWLLSSTGLLLALAPLTFVTFIAAFFVPIYYVYHLAFSFFPVLCAHEIPLSECYTVQGWSVNWSYVVWGIVSIIYGRWSLGRSVGMKVLAGLVSIAATVAAMQLAIELLGLRQYVDAV